MLDFKFDRNILVYIGIVVILGLMTALFSSNKGRIAGKAILRFALGGVFIYVFNLIAGRFNVLVPLNFLTAAITGFLQIPGFVFIIILKYIIYP